MWVCSKCESNNAYPKESQTNRKQQPIPKREDVFTGRARRDTGNYYSTDERHFIFYTLSDFSLKISSDRG